MLQKNTKTNKIVLACIDDKRKMNKILLEEVFIMKFWILMLIADLINPIIMISLGLYLLKNTGISKEVFGFKTAMWQKNIDTEKFAYNFCSKYYLFAGLIILPLSTIVMILIISKTMSTIGLISGIICVGQGFLLASAPLVTEIALRKAFDKDGCRR